MSYQRSLINIINRNRCVRARAEVEPRLDYGSISREQSVRLLIGACSETRASIA